MLEPFYCKICLIKVKRSQMIIESLNSVLKKLFKQFGEKDNPSPALGKLKIIDEALRPGINVDIEVVATRSLGIRSAKQTISWQGAIGKSR